MKRKITGVCLALAVTLGMWCGAQTSIEFASAYAESEEVTDLEDILGDAESENTGETLGDNENGMGDNDTGEIIVDESEEDEADGTDIDLTESEDVEISDAESDSEEVSAIEFNTDETFSDGDEELEEDHQEAETADPEAMVARAASPEGIDAESDDVKAWCQLDFDGYFMVNWNSQENWKTATYPQNAYFSTTGKTVGTYEPNPGPEKKVGDDGMDYEQMSRHEYTQTDPPYEITEGKNFDYMISQRLLPGSYSAFMLQDTLDSCLQFQSASVTTASGKDVTDRFSIQNVRNTVTFTANTAFLKTDEAYNDVTYYFRIKVTAGNNDTIEAHGHYRKNENIYTIENKASRTIISDKMQDTQQTNSSWVKGEIPKEPTDGQITVTKRIREQDITWAHGNPVFRFSVRGTDTSDITHMYEDYVEFRKGEYLTDGEYAVISCTFTNLPMGKYTVSEKKTLRYVVESITAQTSNVSLNDRNGIAVLDRNNKVAAVTFTNKKTRYDRYSHTDVVRNQIHIQN